MNIITSLRRRARSFKHSHHAVSNVLGYLLTITIIFMLFISTVLLTVQTLNNKSYNIIDMESDALINRIADSLLQAVQMQQSHPDSDYTMDIQLPQRLGGTDNLQTFGGSSYYVDITQSKIYLNVSNGVSKTTTTYLTDDTPYRITPMRVLGDSGRLSVTISSSSPLYSIDFNTGNASHHSPQAHDAYFIGDNATKDPWSSNASSAPYRQILSVNNTDSNSIPLDNTSQVCIPITLTPDTFDYSKAIVNEQDEGVISPSAPYIGYNYKRTLTIDPDQISGTFINMPVLVNIQSDPSLSAHVVHEDGADLLFTDSQQRQLYHQIETFDKTAGTLICWVNMTTLSPTDNVLYLYYGKTNVAYENIPTNVWSTDYQSVWHFTAEGQKALYFNGKTNSIDLGLTEYLTENDMSIELLLTKSPDQTGCIFSEKDTFSIILEGPTSRLTPSTNPSNWRSMLNVFPQPADHFNLRYQGWQVTDERWGYVGIDDGEQHHLVVTVDGSNARLYIDNTSLGEKGLRQGPIIKGTSNDYFIGSPIAHDDYLFIKTANMFACFDTSVGIDTTNWTYSSHSYQSDAPIYFTDDNLILRNNNRRISFIVQATGEVLSDYLRPYNSDISYITTDGQTVIITYNYGNRIYAYSQDGSYLRSINNGGDPKYPVIDEDSLYVTRDNQQLRSYDLSTLSYRWATSLEIKNKDYDVQSPLILQGDSLFTIAKRNNRNYLFNISKNTGNQEGSYELNNAFQSQFTMQDGYAYYIDTNDRLNSLELATDTKAEYSSRVDTYYLRDDGIYVQRTDGKIARLSLGDLMNVWIHTPSFSLDYSYLADEVIYYGDDTVINALSLNGNLISTYTSNFTIEYAPASISTKTYLPVTPALVEITTTTDPATPLDAYVISGIKSSIGQNIFEPGLAIDNSYFKGFLDCVRIYNTVLDTTQISQLYQGQRVTDSLQAEYLPTDANIDPSTNILRDTSGNGRDAILNGDLLIYSSLADSTKNNHLLLNYGATDTSAGRIYEAFQLDTPDSLSSSSFNLGMNDWTLEGWIYPTAAGGTYLSKGDQIRIYGIGNEVYFNTHFGGAGGTTKNIHIGTAPLSTWSHLAVTRIGDTFTTYLNGRYVGHLTDTAISSLDYTNDSDWILGAYEGGDGDYFTGTIDEFRISTQGFTQGRIQTGYNMVNNQTGYNRFITTGAEIDIAGDTSPASSMETNIYLIDPASDQQIPYYVTQWDTNGKSIIYINSSSLGLGPNQETYLYLYYGGNILDVHTLDEISIFNENFRELNELWELSYVPPTTYYPPLQIPSGGYLITSTTPLEYTLGQPASYLLQTKFWLLHADSSYTTILSQTDYGYDDAYLFTASKEPDHSTSMLQVSDSGSIDSIEKDTNSFVGWIRQQSNITFDGSSILIHTSYEDETTNQPYLHPITYTGTRLFSNYHIGLGCDIDPTSHASETIVKWIRLIKTTPYYTPETSLGVRETNLLFWRDTGAMSSILQSYSYNDPYLQDGITIPLGGNTFSMEGVPPGDYVLEITQGGEQLHRAAAIDLFHDGLSPSSVRARLQSTAAGNYTITAIPFRITTSGGTLQIAIAPEATGSDPLPLINRMTLYQGTPYITLGG